MFGAIVAGGFALPVVAAGGGQRAVDCGHSAWTAERICADHGGVGRTTRPGGVRRRRAARLGRLAPGAAAPE